VLVTRCAHSTVDIPQSAWNAIECRAGARRSQGFRLQLRCSDPIDPETADPGNAELQLGTFPHLRAAKLSPIWQQPLQKTAAGRPARM